MSYDFWVELDSGDEDGPGMIEPVFNDQLPALLSDGMAGTVMVTASGRVRCGNYTSNVSGMWTRCLTAALATVPAARQWADDDARRFNASGRRYHRFNRETDEWERNVPMDEDTGELRLRDLAGKRCSEIAAVVGAAVAWGVEHLNELRDENPENGWGDARGAITYLWDIQRMCEMHPDADLGDLGMKALTLTQPWATLVAIGAKRFETRSWSTPYRGPLAIHAGKGLSPVGGVRGLRELCEAEPFRQVLTAAGFADLRDMPRGIVVAEAELVGCFRTELLAATAGGTALGELSGVDPTDNERAFGDYSPGRFARALRDVEPATSEPVSGKLGLWEQQR